MKRALLLVCFLGLTGCMGFNEYYQDDMVGYEYGIAGQSPCQPTAAAPTSPRVVPLGPGVIPASAQVPAPPQTREPDLLTPAR